MSQPPKVVIVLARCSRNREPLGIRFEEQAAGRWLGNWAFAVKATTAKKEGYDRSEIRGGIELAPAYPRCPHCQAASIYKCACGQVACWDGESRTVTCPWCGATGELRGHIASLSGGSDV